MYSNSRGVKNKGLNIKTLSKHPLKTNKNPKQAEAGVVQSSSLVKLN